MNENQRASCEEVTSWLLAGAGQDGAEGPGPAISGHLGSCLSCFRVAAELKALPRLEGLLREGPPAGEPGDAFWAAFPARVADAWERDRRAHVPVLPARERLLAWLRAPLPAAFAGAAVAAALVVLATRPDSTPSAPTVASLAPPAASPAPAEPKATAAPAAPDDFDLQEDWVPDEDLDGRAEEVVGELSLGALETVLADLGMSPSGAANMAADGEDDGPSAGEQLDGMSLDELKKVALALGGGTRI